MVVCLSHSPWFITLSLLQNCYIVQLQWLLVDCNNFFHFFFTENAVKDGSCIARAAGLCKKLVEHFSHSWKQKMVLKEARAQPPRALTHHRMLNQVWFETKNDGEGVGAAAGHMWCHLSRPKNKPGITPLTRIYWCSFWGQLCECFVCETSPTSLEDISSCRKGRWHQFNQDH